MRALAGDGAGGVSDSDGGTHAAAPARDTLLPAGLSPREAWIRWLSPSFTGNDSCYITGTYSDEYGFPNGLMIVRNVHKDFTRFLESFDFTGDYICGVEPHAFRDILHCHGILQGPFTDPQLKWIKSWWASDRGHCRTLPVQDGCASYVTKYALKGDTDSFGWRLS